LNLARFLEIFDKIEQMTRKLVWLPTWHQARLVCRQLGINNEVFEKQRQRCSSSEPVEELLGIYELIVETLKIGDQLP
jgi:hypothetical protein